MNSLLYCKTVDPDQLASSEVSWSGSSLFSKNRYIKTCLKWPLYKNTKIGFQDRLLLNEGQKYRRMLQGVHSAIL